MAELFLARRRAPGGVEKRVVIKRIRRERAGDSRFAEMFVREARLSMSLAHKNIVPVFDFGRAGDELFLVMEFVDGVDLATALARAGERGAPLDPVLVAFIGLEACQALEYAHQVSGLDGEPQGVIHRDVTPANVLLSYSGEVKLLDFGIATSETAVGEQTRVRGTPPYMAPEQARGEALSARTDVFAVGLVLWEALAGRRAYPGKEVADVLALARRGEVAPLDPDRAPAPLREIVARATRADPAERFDGAGAMHLALDEYLVDARAGIERRGPTHQMLAAWVRGLFPGREQGGGAGGATIALPAGPVATFLDDGEERVTHLFPQAEEAATARSIAATVEGSEGSEGSDGKGEEDGEREEEQESRDRESGDLESRGRETGDGEDGRGQAGDGEDARAGAASAGATHAGPTHPRARSRWLRRGVVAAALAIAVGGAAVAARNLAPGDEAAAPPRASSAAPGAAAPGVVSRREAAPARPAAPAGTSPGVVPPPAATPSGDISAARPETQHHIDPVRATPRAAPAHPSGDRDGGRGHRAAARGAGTSTGSATGATGTVRISSSPWAEVRVVGRSERCAETPCSVVLPAGTHTLALRNPVAQVGKTLQVVVRAGETMTVRETLTPPHP